MLYDKVLKEISKIKSQKINLHLFDEIDSTHIYIKKYENDITEKNSFLVIANKQTLGVGRDNSNWHNEANKHIMFSFGFQLDRYRKIQCLPLAVAESIASTLNKYKIEKEYIKIKWPNDLYSYSNNNGWGKCCGILTDCIQKKDRYIVYLGVGINIKPIDIKIKDYNAGYYKTNITSEGLLYKCIKGLLDIDLESGAFLKRYKEIDFLKNKYISLFKDKTKKELMYKGIAKGLSDSGQLKIMTTEGIKTVINPGHIEINHKLI